MFLKPKFVLKLLKNRYLYTSAETFVVK